MVKISVVATLHEVGVDIDHEAVKANLLKSPLEDTIQLVAPASSALDDHLVVQDLTDDGNEFNAKKIIKFGTHFLRTKGMPRSTSIFS